VPNGQLKGSHNGCPLKRPHLELRVRRTISPLGCFHAPLVTMLNRVAVRSDIHGVLPTLEAVLAEPDLSTADHIVLTGDITAAPPLTTGSTCRKPPAGRMSAS
jgi:hypothetical protein